LVAPAVSKGPGTAQRCAARDQRSAGLRAHTADHDTHDARIAARALLRLPARDLLRGMVERLPLAVS